MKRTYSLRLCAPGAGRIKFRYSWKSDLIFPSKLKLVFASSQRLSVSGWKYMELRWCDRKVWKEMECFQPLKLKSTVKSACSLNSPMILRWKLFIFRNPSAVHFCYSKVLVKKLTRPTTCDVSWQPVGRDCAKYDLNFKNFRTSHNLK